MKTKKTLVIGASTNPDRYSNLAIHKLIGHQHPVVALGNKNGIVAGIDIDTTHKPYTDIDTVTLYINPTLQKEYQEYILSLHPKRVIFNPGTENDEFADLLKQHDIQPQEACTLVLLSTGQY